MSDVIITVRGEHNTRVPAEIGIPAITVRLDGPDRAAIVARANELTTQIHAELTALQASGAARTFSTDRISIWADRPWNQDGEQLPFVHHASMGARAEFSDFAALSEWLGVLSEREGVAVDNLAWDLTRQTRARVESEVAQQAVGVAVTRATAYAQALSLTTVEAREIADVGLLDAASPKAQGAPMMMRASAMMADGGSSDVALEPREIQISATVEARFAAH